MVCKSCNRFLNDFEATRKYEGTTEYVDLCNRCFNSSDVNYNVDERYDLQEEDYQYTEEDFDDSDELFEE